DYSKYSGTCVRTTTSNPIVTKGCKGKGNTIYCGVSSLQNLFNVGLTSGTPNYTGYPYYTDQGFLFRIDEDSQGDPKLTWRSPTCAPQLFPGDTLTKGSQTRDPFQLSKTSLIIGTVSDALI